MRGEEKRDLVAVICWLYARESNADDKLVI